MNFSYSIQRRSCSAGFPACGFGGLSSPRFVSAPSNTELESSVNPQTRMSALRANRLTFQLPRHSAWSGWPHSVWT